MSRQPDYQRIVDDITARIDAGILRPGEMLPSYKDLAEAYDVGLSTVGAAMRMLKDRGRVVGQSGKATFVADPERDGA